MILYFVKNYALQAREFLIITKANAQCGSKRNVTEKQQIEGLFGAYYWLNRAC